MTRGSPAGNETIRPCKRKARRSRALTNVYFDQLMVRSVAGSVSPPVSSRAGPVTNRSPDQLLGELGDLVGKARDLPARVVLVNDVALRCLHQFRLGAGERLQRRFAVGALDRFLDGADRATHLGAARLVDDGATSDLACRLLGGSRIGHGLKFLR